ncbi:hypothetical protein C8R47DRAFT_1229838 [Mycena vitilis]|nr:hypothetical protein C8R47DRAFT_1229838 [Mycena vitilis]
MYLENRPGSNGSIDVYTKPRAPLLGIYNTVAISMLLGRPYDDQWEYVFASIDLHTLFELSLHSREMCQLVLAYVRQHSPASFHPHELLSGGPLDYMAKLPVEIMLLIYDKLRLKDARRLAFSSRKLRALYARHVQATVARFLMRFQLSHAEIRFMQTATLTILTGSRMARIFDSEATSSTLAFYATAQQYAAVLRFIRLATRYQGTSTDFPSGSHGTGVDHSTTFYHPSLDLSFCVNRSHTDSALDPIPYFPLTHMFFVVTHRGVWSAYERATVAGITIPNRECTSISTGAGQQHLAREFSNCVSDYRVDFHLTVPHLCGKSFDCPATARDSMDAGCLNLFFPCPPMGDAAESRFVYPFHAAMSWSLGASACPGTQQPGRRITLRSREDSCAYFISTFLFFLARSDQRLQI